MPRNLADNTTNVIPCQETDCCVSMVYMEIALLSKKTLRIKGKFASLVIDPKEKIEANASILLSGSGFPDLAIPLVIAGPGSYEVGGVKIAGTRSGDAIAYRILIDGVGILIGQLSNLSKMQQKLQDNNIVLAICDEGTDASFLGPLAKNALILVGPEAESLGQLLGKENLQVLAKYQTTKDKLPQEVETIVLN